MSIAARCYIKPSKVSDNLYRSCEMPLKQKLIKNCRIADNVKSTAPAVMKSEIGCLCRPKVNFCVEREQFH